MEILTKLPEDGIAAESTKTPPPNKQLYSQSELAGSVVEQELLSSDVGLFNPKLPNLAIIHEKAEHRLIVYLKGQGYSNREVAAKLGYTEAWVSQVVRQPWFQLRLLEEMKQSGRDALDSFLHAQAEPSIVTLCNLRDHAESESVRATCAINILDRVFGKPVQRSEVKMAVAKVTEQVESINEELAKLEAEERELNKNAIEVSSGETSGS